MPQLRWQEESVATPPTKVFAMLCYLALNPGGCSRKDLAELLWETTKTGSVRVALSELRHLPGAETWLETQDQLVQVKAVTDVAQFEKALQAEAFARAMTLWHDGYPLLSGFEMRGGEPFKTWLELERSRLGELYLEALQGYLRTLEAGKNYPEALELAKELLDKDKLNETVHRTIMRLEHKRGNTEAALAQFERLRQVLQEELGVEPLDETLALLREIEQGSVSAGKTALLLTSPESIPAKPDKLIGRTELLAELKEKLKAGGRALLHGFGGTGKTALAATFAAQNLAEKDGDILWLQAGDDDPDTLFDAIAGTFDARQAVSKSSSKVQAVHTLLAKAKLRLFVLDDAWNAYALSKVSEALPEGLPLLVTARQRYPTLQRIDVGRLARESSLELLSHHANAELDEQADQLCELLGDHAFALRIAGVTLNIDERSSSDLLRRIGDDPHTMKLPSELAEEGRESVASLLSVTTQALSDAAYEALMAFGVLFTSSSTPELLALCIRRDKEATEDALIELQKRALADRVTEAGSDVISYRLHDLVFSFARANNNLRDITAMRACSAFLERHQQNFDVLDAEILNILGGVETAKSADAALFIDMMQMLVVDNAYYQARGHSPRSLDMLKTAVDTAKEVNASKEGHYLTTKLGDAYRELLGNLPLALTAYQEALKLAQSYGDHYREAILLSLIGITRFQQNADDADEYLEQAYNLAKTKGDNLALGQIQHHRGGVFALREEWQNAYRVLQEAVDVIETFQAATPGEKSVVEKILFFSLLNLGEAERKLNKFEQALQTRLRVWQLACEQDNQLRMAYALHEIAEMYHDTQERELAQENYRKALTLYQQNNAVADIKNLTDFMEREGYKVAT